MDLDFDAEKCVMGGFVLRVFFIFPAVQGRRFNDVKDMKHELSIVQLKFAPKGKGHQKSSKNAKTPHSRL